MLRTLLVTLFLFAAVCGALVLWQPALLDIPRVIMLVREKPVLPYPVPVQGVRTQQLTDQWGAPRSGGRKHQGIDIFAKCGTPVLSVTRGLVTRVGTNMLGGQIVRVLGPGGYWHYYAHLSEYGDIREGQLVQAGTVLGKVGDTGNARGTPCHLHYGVYSRGGGAENPYPLLTAAPATKGGPGDSGSGGGVRGADAADGRHHPSGARSALPCMPLAQREPMPPRIFAIGE